MLEGGKKRSDGEQIVLPMFFPTTAPLVDEGGRRD
jgi:hypothetical protein